MATAARITVTATAARIDQNSADNLQGHSVVVRNTQATASDAVNLGASNVAAGTGFTLQGGQQIELELNDPEQLWAIRATGAALDPVLHILYVS